MDSISFGALPTAGSEFAVYARCAAGSKSAIEEQVRHCMEYDEKIGIVHNKANIYTDNGVSGNKIPRSGLQGLQTVVREKKATFRTVIVTDPARLSRNLGDISQLLMFFTFHSVALVVVESGTLLTVPVEGIKGVQ